MRRAIQKKKTSYACYVCGASIARCRVSWEGSFDCKKCNTSYTMSPTPFKIMMALIDKIAAEKARGNKKKRGK